MDRERETSRQDGLLRISVILGYVVAGIGGVVIFGWVLDIPRILQLAPGMASMKLNTALGFLLGGSGAAFLGQARGKPLRWTAVSAGVLIAILGGLTLWQDVTGVDLGIDQAFLQDPGQSPYPGRMSPMTAVSFILAGTSISAAYLSFIRIFQALATSLLMLSMVPLLGYAYDVSSLYSVGPYSSMALHTAAAFHLLALSLLARNYRCELFRLVIAESAGGIAARRLLPIIPAGIFLVGWFCVVVARRGGYDAFFSLALLSMLCIFFSAGIVLWHARLLHRVDEARREKTEEVHRMNENLEALVASRTRQLQDSLDHVKTLQGLLPLCAWCKKVRDDKDYWHEIETYLSRHTDTRVTHSICPDCYQKLQREMAPNLLPTDGN